MQTAVRVFVVLLGIFFTFQGVGWLIDPAAAAAGLGMPLLDGLGRSTQVGDFAMFFLAAGATILLGSLPGRERVLYFPALLVGGAALTRTIAWAAHGADFAALFIAVELVTGGLLLTAARRSGQR
jgi:hypothetical protein